MSTELATIPAPPQITFVGAASIEATARALVDAHKIGTALCRTAFVPKHFQGKPDDAAAAILYGSTINMDPVTALQNVYVIGGKPALYARTMVAIVMSHGHSIWTEEESEGRVTVAGQRKGSDVIERVTWTTEMAQRAGYLSNAKYKTDPRSMLYARASGDVARRIAPDALLGMAHNVEELTISEPDASHVTASAAEKMRAALNPSPAPDAGQPEGARHEAGAETSGQPQAMRADVPAGEDSPYLNTSSKLAKALFAAMGERGISSREDRLEFCSLTLGREVASSTDLTEDDARTMLRRLDEMEPDQPLIDVTDGELVEDPA